jgi:pyruvate kinase
MNVLRINCAHEGERAWGQMIRALGEAKKESGKECRALMDLAGPKIRTGPVAVGRHIGTWKPAKNSIGEVEVPARVVIHRASAPPAEGTSPFLFMSEEAFAKVRKGDKLHFRDARDKKRALAIQEVGRAELVGSSTAHTYLLERARARLHRAGEHEDEVTIEVGGDAQDAVIDIKRGDALILTRRAADGKRRMTVPAAGRRGGRHDARQDGERGHRASWKCARIGRRSRATRGRAVATGNAAACNRCTCPAELFAPGSWRARS